jgi:3-methyladenine DNA glycosylase AlkC
MEQSNNFHDSSSLDATDRVPCVGRDAMRHRGDRVSRNRNGHDDRQSKEVTVPTADELLSSSQAKILTKCLRAAAPERTWNTLSASVKSFGDLGLVERAMLVRDALLSDLPDSYVQSAKIIRTALKNDSFRSWMTWPVGEAVSTLAIASPRDSDFDDGLKMLAQLTGRFTSEFAIRNFLNADLERTLNAALVWAINKDEDIRRLASEGTRPRLPWAKQVPAFRTQPTAAISILDILYTDESETVRRSVANHLNDISRAEPELAVRTATRWLSKPDETTSRLVRHAMRTLIKQAYPGALALLGFGAPEGIVISGPTVQEDVVSLGSELVFEGSISNEGTSETRLVIDYVVHYRKANGATAPKVFKLSTKTLLPGERLEIRKRHSFKPISTRKHYVGQHSVELQVNGMRSKEATFDVVV